MKIKRTLLSLLLIMCMLVPLAACDQGGAEVTSVEFDQAEVSVNVGQEISLTYTVFPQGANTADATWLSSDPSVATVNNGVVKGIKEGNAAIRISIGDKRSQCRVTVVDPSLNGGAATGVSLNRHSLTLAQVGASDTLSATVEPADAAQNVTWASSDTEVVTVNAGVVTAVAPGSAVVSVRTSNNYFDNCVVKVEGIVPDPELYVAKVDSLADRSDFIMAMDSSELLSLEDAREASNLTFKDFDGNEADILQVLKDNGITDIRIRVWNDPYADEAKQQPYGGGNCDVDNAVELSKRCEKVGLGVIIDFHYSDFWADPGKQKAPKDWENMNLQDKTDALEEFTTEALTKIKETNVKIKMVQIGNETTGGLAGETDWNNIYTLMKAGAKAVRDVTGAVANDGAKIAVHFTNAGNNDYVSRAKKLQDAGVDYDVFGTSWYPYYSSHGTLAGLTKQLKEVHDKYNKQVMVLETAYAFTRDDFDGCGNTALESTTQPLTVQGMANAVRDVIKAIADLGDYGLGVAYWGGTWVAASESTVGATNREICKKYGCGWATSYAHDYDSSANDGGSMVDNNAFFLSDGSPIEALKVFKYVKEGHTPGLHADYLEDQELYYTVGQGTIELPKTVSVVLNNGSAMETSAVWAIEPSDLTAYIDKVDTYTIEGTTSFGGTCYCHVWVTNVNLLTEGSFEGLKAYGAQNGGFISVGSMGDWKATYNNSGSGNLQLYVSNESQNAVMGTNSFHWWDSGKVDFKLYQMADMSKITENGSYTCSFEIQGDQGVNVDIHAYIKVTYKDGSTKVFDGNKISNYEGWQNWIRTSASVTIEDVADVTSIEVGISVYSETVGEGPWGNIDNCQFYYGG